MNPTAQLWNIVNINGNLNAIKANCENCQSLDDITRQLPDGAYTTLRTYNHWQALHLDNHFFRLEETCKLAGFDLHLDQNQMRLCLRSVLQELSEIEDLRLRISIDLTSEKGSIYISAEALTVPPAEAYVAGVNVITKTMHRDNPKAKMTGFLKSTSEIRREMTAGVNEGLMISPDGRILEGLSSNFFAVKNNTLYTEEKDVLSGITRSIVFEVAEELNISLVKEGIRVDEIDGITEAFITSTSRLVLPVKQIDDTKIGQKMPGVFTEKIMSAFQEKITDALEVN